MFFCSRRFGFRRKALDLSICYGREAQVGGLGLVDWVSNITQKLNHPWLALEVLHDTLKFFVGLGLKLGLNPFTTDKQMVAWGGLNFLVVLGL